MEPDDDQVEQVAREMWDEAWRTARQAMPRLARALARGSTWETCSRAARINYRGYARTAISAWEAVR